jgi:hypothetical protein
MINSNLTSIKIALSIRRFFALTISIFALTSCSSTQQSQTRPAPSSCTIEFYNDSHQALCRWYYDGLASFGNRCNQKIINELDRQGRQVFPRASCGQPKPSSIASECKRKYQYSSPQTMCDVYHFNRDLTCDSTIRDIFTEKNLALTPRSSCGAAVTPISSPQSSTCRRSVTGETTARLCTLYWDNLDVACDSTVRQEIIRRTGSIGTNKSACIQIDNAPRVQACTGYTIGQLNLSSNQQLCTLASGKTDCRRLAEALMIGKGLKSKQACGETSQDECSALVRSLAARSDGVAEACRVKNDKNQILGVKCRRSLNGFLLGRQVSPGNSAAACGQPIRADDLAAFRTNQ